ncbi:MAG: hypothetical protein OXG40_07200 [Acidimicrobiaceae bacterium]|nr:hypothetical protein [Acidimicrobiaceae bacterium]MDE0517735.1 hypothetical protein [Acidimicrobiaceae bacterium]
MPAYVLAIERLAELSIDVAESASTLQLPSRAFEVSSIARMEESLMAAAGITDEDLTCMASVREMLDTYTRSATEHIRAAAVLMSSGEPDIPVLSMAALSRISSEASNVAFWLCDPDISWSDRLKRCNQLQYKMLDDALQGSQSFSKYCPTPAIVVEIEAFREYRDRVLNWAKQRNWSQEGRPPSRKGWLRAIRFTQLMRELAESSGAGPDFGQILYSSGSGTVHSNPILVERALFGFAPEVARYAAAIKVKQALRCHCLLMERVEKWTGWLVDTRWFNEVEDIYWLLFNQLPPDVRQEYEQRLSAIVRFAQSRGDM